MVALVGLRSSEVVGVAAGHLQPGKIGMVWPPRSMSGESQSTSVDLLRGLVQRLKESGMQLVQAFPDIPSRSDEELLFASGFDHVADLLYLVSTDRDFPAGRARVERGPGTLLRRQSSAIAADRGSHL